MREDSDIDIGFLANKKHDSMEVFLSAQKLATVLKREVDLVQLQYSTTVFQKEVISKGICIFKTTESEQDQFELLVLKKYMRLNEERAEILKNYSASMS